MDHMTYITPLTRIIVTTQNYDIHSNLLATSKVNIEISDL